MKDTGMIRRIDNLGRIVIPKEIRNSMLIKEGSPLEISIDNGKIVLKKYDTLNSIAEIGEELCEVLYDCLHFPVLMTTTSMPVVCVGTSKKSYINKALSSEVVGLIHDSKNYIASKSNNTTLIPIVVGEDIKFSSQVLFPIVCDGVCEGMLVALSDDENEIPQSDIKVLQAIACFASKQLKL